MYGGVYDVSAVPLGWFHVGCVAVSWSVLSLGSIQLDLPLHCLIRLAWFVLPCPDLSVVLMCTGTCHPVCTWLGLVLSRLLVWPAALCGTVEGPLVASRPLNLGSYLLSSMFFVLFSRFLIVVNIAAGCVPQC